MSARKFWRETGSATGQIVLTSNPHPAPTHPASPPALAPLTGPVNPPRRPLYQRATTLPCYRIALLIAESH